MTGKLDLDRIYAEDVIRKKAKKERHKEITLRDYLELLKKDPLIAQNSPSRLFEICLASGVEPIPEKERWLGVEKSYPLFSNKLFGIILTGTLSFS